MNFTLGPTWADHYLTGMMLLHVLLGRDVAVVPKVPPTHEILISALQDIASGRYDHNRYFVPGRGAAVRIVTEVPSLTPTESYAIVTAGVSTTRSQFISVTTGGAAFEDPFWAILAAHAWSRNVPVSVPIAHDAAGLWRRVPEAAAAIQQGSYRPEDFFAKALGPYPEGTVGPAFALAEVPATTLAALRFRGMQSFAVNGSLRFFELFQPPDRGPGR